MQSLKKALYYLYLFLKCNYHANRLCYVCRDVAQLVAHSLWERGVVSSSLAIPTTLRSSKDELRVAGHFFKGILSARFASYPNNINTQTMFYVYIIQSTNHTNQIYIGFTGNLTQRLEYHNSGKSLYTKTYKPWKITAYFAFDTQEKATAFEQYLKTGSGYEFIRRRVL